MPIICLLVRENHKMVREMSGKSQGILWGLMAGHPGWICGVKLWDDPSMDELHAKLGICDLAILVREHRLRWFGHVMRSNGEINRVRSRPVPGRKGPGRPKTWEECVKQDLKVCGLSEAGTQDRLLWRSSVKNSRQEPTPSNGSLPQSMAAPPARRVLGMRTRSFNKTGFDWLIDTTGQDGCLYTRAVGSGVWHMMVLSHEMMFHTQQE